MAKEKGPEPKLCGPSDDQWKVEDALRTLSRAEEIKSDPELMKKVRGLAEDKVEDFAKIAGLAKRGLISDKQAERMRKGSAE